MRRGDLIVAILCFGLAAVVLEQSVPHYFTDRGDLGSGVYPCFVAALLATCGLSIFIQWFRGNRQAKAAAFFPRGEGESCWPVQLRRWSPIESEWTFWVSRSPVWSS